MQLFGGEDLKNMQLLAPTLEDLDLLLSWLPSQGADGLRRRLAEARVQLLRQTIFKEDVLAKDATADGSVLSDWLEDVDRELDDADEIRSKEVLRLLEFLDR